MPSPVEIVPARGKLGVLLVGLGAVSTTTIAGVLAIRKGIAKPIGSLTQMGTIRLAAHRARDRLLYHSRAGGFIAPRCNEGGAFAD